MSEHRFPPDELDSLLAVYALDAIDDPAERAAVESYLESNPRAAAEVQSYREALSYLPPGSPAPRGLWDQIEAQLSDVPPPLDLTPFEAPVVAIARARARRSRWPELAAAAAAVVALVAAASVIVAQRSDLKQDAIAREAAAAEGRDSSRVIEMRDGSGSLTVRAIAEPDGDVYVRAGGLPRLDPSRTYQVWCVREQTPVSLGVIGARPDTVKVYADACRGALAITNEAAGGVAIPQQAPVVAGSFN